MTASAPARAPLLGGDRPLHRDHGAETNLGAIRYLFLGVRRAPLWQVVVPVIGIAFLVFTIYKNVKGTSFPYDRFPFVVLVWLAVGGAIVVLAPGLARRIGAGLGRREGIGADEPPAPRSTA